MIRRRSAWATVAPDSAAGSHEAAASRRKARGQPTLATFERGGRLAADREVDDVGGAEEEEGKRDQQPGPLRPPPRGGEGPAQQPEQDEVEAWIGEADRHPERAAAEGFQHRREDQGGGDAGHGEGADQAVDPGQRVEVGDPRPQQQDQRQVAGGVEGEEERVGRRGERGRARVVEDDRVVGLSQRPEQQAGAEREPGPALGLEQQRAREDDQRGAEDDRVVSPAPDRVLQRSATERPENDDGIEGQEAREEPQRGKGEFSRRLAPLGRFVHSA